MFCTENRAIYEIIRGGGGWKETAGQDIDNNVIQRIRFVSCIPKATDTHPEYVILPAFPRHQSLRNGESPLR
jgi:hypothetical protein